MTICYNLKHFNYFFAEKKLLFKKNKIYDYAKNAVFKFRINNKYS